LLTSTDAVAFTAVVGGGVIVVVGGVVVVVGGVVVVVGGVVVVVAEVVVTLVTGISEKVAEIVWLAITLENM
jgi:hypothetical protein